MKKFILSVSVLTSSLFFALSICQLSNAQGSHVAPQSAQIKSQEELSTYIKMTPKKASPLHYFSESERVRFLSSLTFNEKGLTSFNFGSLKSELNYNQAFRVLSLFGAQYTIDRLYKSSNLKSDNAQSMMAADYPWRKCDGVHNCVKTTDDIICLSSC